MELVLMHRRAQDLHLALDTGISDFGLDVGCAVVVKKSATGEQFVEITLGVVRAGVDF